MNMIKCEIIKIYLQNFKKGVAFLGVFIKPWRIYIGKRIKQNFFVKVKIWNNFSNKKSILNNGKETKKFIAETNSYLGIMQHYATIKLRKKMVRSFDREIFRSVIFSHNLKKAMVVVNG